MNEKWQRIEAWFAKNVPGDFYADGFGPVPLPKGASEEQIQAAEIRLDRGMDGQLTFPEDVRESYLLHNGWEFGNLLPVERIPEFWQMCIDRDSKFPLSNSGLTMSTIGPIKNDYWNPRWIPLTDCDGPTYFCVDLDPAEGGQTGQVIYVDCEFLEKTRMMSYAKMAGVSWDARFLSEIQLCTNVSKMLDPQACLQQTRFAWLGGLVRALITHHGSMRKG